MTYDKVQFAMNTNRLADRKSETGSTDADGIEGKKRSTHRNKTKRKSCYEISLDHIEESHEPLVSPHIDRVPDRESVNPVLVTRNKVIDQHSDVVAGIAVSIERTMSESTDSEFNPKTNESEDDDVFGDLRKGINKEPMEIQTEYDVQTSVDSDELIEERRDTKDKGVRYEQNSRNQTMPTINHDIDSEYSSLNGTVHETNQLEKLKHKSLTTIAASSPSNVNSVENGVKLPSVNKCQHMLHKNGPDRDLNLRKKFKQWDRLDDSCIICEITEATAKYASVEANRMLMEIVYPHQFYDKFQRSGKSKSQSGTVDRASSITKDTINICKQAKVSPKLGRRERTMPVTYRSAEPTHTPSARESFRKWASDRLEHHYIEEKRAKREEKSHGSNEAHVHCKEKTSSFVITDDSEGQKLILKGLKGWLMKHTDCKRPKENRDTKKSLYQVNSLGIQFGIPEYNPSLHDRKPTSPSPGACANSPRHVETHQLIKRPVTHIVSPRVQFHTNQNMSRDIHTVPTRATGGLGRTYTHTLVPKLFADKLDRDETGVIETDRESAKHKNSSRKQATRFSLPPIGHDLSTRSLTLSHI